MSHGHFERKGANFILLLRSINVLLSQNISEENLEQCEIDLTRFVGETEILCGKSVMTFNIHSSLHVVHSVRMTGPLWATSAFPYENGIFHLKQNIHGPNGLLFQIATKNLQRSTLQNMVISNKSETCELYCKRLFSPRKLVLQYNITECGAVLIGERIVGHDKLKNLLKKLLVSKMIKIPLKYSINAYIKTLSSTARCMNDQKKETIPSFNCNHPL